MIFCIETILMVFFWKIEVYSPEKFSPAHFGPFLVQILVFLGPTYLLKLVCDLGLDLSVVIVYVFSKLNGTAL